MSTERPEILSLTSLRLVAALYVYLFHMNMIAPLAAEGTYLAHFLKNGAVGMSLFFMLSGFVLGYRYEGQRISFATYGFARFARIYPVYVAAAAVTLPWLYWHLESTAAVGTQKGLMYVYMVVANTFMLQAWVPQLFSYWNNDGSWSLSVEAFFYAIFPALMLLIHTLSPAGRGWLMLAAYVAAVFAGLSMLLFAGLGISVFYSIPIYRLGEFVVGVLLGTQFAQGNRIAFPEWVMALSCGSLVLYLAAGPDFGAVYVANNFAVVPLIGAVLFSAACLPKGPLRSAVELPPFVYLGKISYSFYSFQALVLLSIRRYRELLLLHAPWLGDSWTLALVAALLLTAIASVSYILIEVWFRSALMSRRLRTNSAFSATARKSD